MAGVRAISGNLGLVRALHFPRASLPVSFALQQLQQLLFSMIVLFAVAIAFGSYPDLSWALIVPVLALQFLFNTGLALIMARAGVEDPGPRAAHAVRDADVDVRVRRDVLHPDHAGRQAAVDRDRPAVEPGRPLHGPDALRPHRRLRLREPARPRLGGRGRLGAARSPSAASCTSGRRRRGTAVAEPQDGRADPHRHRGRTAHRLPRQRRQDRQGQRHLRPQPHPQARRRARRTQGARRPGRLLRRLPGRGHRPDRLQRLRQVDPAARHRRPAPRRGAARSTPTASPRCSASTRP